MAKKPTYEELEQRIKELEGESVKLKKADESLIESEERFRFLSKVAFEAILFHKDGILLEANDRYYDMFGYKPHELLNRQAIPLTVAPESIDFLKSQISSGSTASYEAIGMKKNGEKFPIEVHSRKIKYKGRNIRSAAIRDLTKRKQVEEVLRKSEEKFRGLFNDALDMIHIVDADGKIVNANQVELETMVYTRDEYIGKHILEILHPDYQSVSKAALNMAFGGKEVKGLETAWITKHGKRIDVEVNAVPLTEMGKIVSVRTIARDITKRKQAREALRKSEEQHKSLVENIALGVALIDLDHNVVTANRFLGKMLDKHPNELIGKKCFQEFEKREKVCPHCPGVPAMKTGQTAEVDTVGVRDDGTKFNARVCAFPVFGSNDTVTGFIQIVEDTTEKNELEAQLQMSQKMEAIGTLAGGIAHDFNNLLMGIQGNTSLMFKDIDSSHTHYERLQSIEKQIQSGVKLTSQILGYARKGKYEVIPINLNQIVNETSDTFGQTKKEIVIRKKLAKDLYAIGADQGQIEQVLLNLFVNAADAMTRRGNLYLETKNVTKKAFKNKPYKPTSDKYVLLIVKDTGIGMDKSTVERIFEPFFTTKEMGRGTGLGLASVYGIVKAHGGYIDVKSKKNTGTTFSVYLPATKRKVKKAAKTSDKLIKGTGTILLVDDEEFVRVLCKELLEAIGCRVLSAEDAQEAIKLYRNNKDEIDIVLLDMVMPNMSGGEVYDSLKEINPEVKVLLSSGYSIDGEATEILNRGCNGFIQKPFDIKKLSAKISKILNNK